jgi:hypothetical protein
MSTPSAPHCLPGSVRSLFLRSLALSLVLLGGVSGAAAQGVQAIRLAVDPPRQPHQTVLRVLSSRGHMQCPLPGRNKRLLSIDSPREWEDTIESQDEVTALGRKVRWSRERVLVYALDTKTQAGVRLESPTKVLRLSQGILYWPVRQIQPEGGRPKASAPARPCVLVTIDRAYWHRIKVVPASS